MKTKFFSECIFNIDVTWEFSSDKALQKKIDSFHSFRTEVIFFSSFAFKTLLRDIRLYLPHIFTPLCCYCIISVVKFARICEEG